MNRLVQSIDPNQGVTQFAYDVNDNLTSVTDPRGLQTTYNRNGFGDTVQLVSPDSGSKTNTYDSAGNLRASTDGRGSQVNFSYDALNRVTQQVYADDSATFVYDAGANGIGHLTGIADANYIMAWSYDPQGRVNGKVEYAGGISKAVGYAYVNDDRSVLILPSETIVQYAYTNHRITSISVNGSTILSNVTFEPFGAVNGWNWGNATAESRFYNQDGIVTQMSIGADTLQYGIDDASRVTSITDPNSGSNNWLFDYDPLDRLTSGSSPVSTSGWTYDANGNRLAQTGATAYTNTIAASSNQLASYAGTSAGSVSYDAAGNTTNLRDLSLSYNQAGRVSSINSSNSSATYLYNALGQMIKKTVGGVTTLLFYDEGGHILGEFSSTGALIEETIWMDDIPVATVRPNASGTGISVYYVHADQMNTPRSITRTSDNAVLWSWQIDPFGTTAANQNPQAVDGMVYNLRFPGQYYQAESGLNYNYYRDYDPQTGRYLEPDPIGQLFYFNISNTRGVSQLHRGYWNKLYAYVDDDPIKLKDPTGLGRFDWFWDLFKEKTPEEITTKGLAAGFGAQCIAQNCGKSRDPIDLYGDCASILNDWLKKMGAGAMGAINGITGDGGEGVVSDCAELCEKGISSGSCCNKGQKQ